MANRSDIRFWNRRLGREETEHVYGGAFVRFAYQNPLGRILESKLLSQPFFSRWYGMTQDSPSSAKKIPGFVRKFHIPMEDYEEREFRNFNDFFVRRFREGKRLFVSDTDLLAAPAEARYFAYTGVDDSVRIPVKGVFLSAQAVLGKLPGKEAFSGGPCLLARLCPVDYHRFHFPCDGRVELFHRETGPLHSVNPLALQADPEIFLKNERSITVLHTEKFGKLAYVEVGATCVGKIVQSRSMEVGQKFWRGEEKGYFLFGASTVIVYGEKGAFTPDEDLLKNTARGIETLVELGSRIAKAAK